MGLVDASDLRLSDLTRWVLDELGFADGRIETASADASFRRYFRVTRGEHSYIVMDAPPGKEDLEPFLRVGRILLDIGVNVPVVLAKDLRRGFLLLSDLGSRQYLDELAADGAAERLYADALESLYLMQAAEPAVEGRVPAYGRDLLMREMELMPDWFLRRHLALQVSDREAALLRRSFDMLAGCALEQPAALVHRDYHSRNLLVREQRNPGILDFQDAVWGAITYDLVSLLKDCYIAWPRTRVRAWALAHRARLRAAGRPAGRSDDEFLRWFDLMGLQRHIKVL
ncbi:MAG TPA: phosphotransferase, partial [Steroidobacteraceae bacterium]|nr:phosphotransferase [Steroidobacteraceae bacterium]